MLDFRTFGTRSSAELNFFEPFKHLWWALGKFYYDIFAIVGRMNLPWTVAMVPWSLLLVFLFLRFVSDEVSRDAVIGGKVPPDVLVFFPLLTAVTMILAAPATAALYNSAQEMDDLIPISFGQFGRGFRHYFGRAWRLAVVDLFILYALVLAFIFYRAQENMLVQILAIVALYPILFWLMVQPFLFPLLLRTELGIVHVFRNASLLAIGNFGNTMGLLVITVISFIGIVPLNIIAVVVGPEVVAKTGLRTVGRLIEKYEIRGPTN